MLEGKTKIGLGTAQFGLDYGISNQHGQNSHEEVSEILNKAKEFDVDLLDTSPNYGNSEEVLGKCLAGDNQFNIVTKTPVFDNTTITKDSTNTLFDYYDKSLANLGFKKLYGLLVHHADNLIVPGGKCILDALNNLKEKGLIEKIGVSVYDGDQIDDVLNLFKPDIVQLPINLFDQRLIHSGHIEKLKNMDVEIHARSIFLQGLLLMQEMDIPEWFKPIKKHLAEYFDYLAKNGLTPHEATIGFVKSIPEIDYVILGVNNVEHLRNNIAAFNKNINLDFTKFAIEDEKMINPSMWVLS